MKDKTCVGTLTFHQSDNYGAVLQAYALQKCIDEMGFNTKVINYYSEGIAYWNRQVSIKDGLSLHNIKNYIWQRINRKCPIYIVSTVWRGTVGRNVKNVSDCSPEMFLSYLKNAEVVITNSFHGTAFSILFNKEFWVQPLSRNNTNSRIDSILALMGLEQRKTLETDVNDTVGIEYDVVNTRLDIFRENSLSILKSMLV